MSSSTNQPVGYPSIKHLVSIAEEETKGVGLNLLAKKLLTWEDREELNFSDVRTFLRHVEATPKEIYNSVIKLWKHFVLVDKQNQKLKTRFTNYKKANKAYFIDNIQLKAKNNNLENWLANLEKQLEIARSDKHPTPSSLPLSFPSASPLPPASASNNSDGKSRHSHRFHRSRKTKLTKLPDPPMLTNSNTVRFDINVWKSKMAKKLSTNADHYDTKALRMAYMDSRVDGDTYKHLAARSKIGAWKPFATAEEMFKVLQKAYGDVNQKHTAMNKFRNLKMTKDFNSFWTEFQVLVSELDHNKSTFITELKYKLTLSLSQAMAGGMSWLKNLHEYA